MTQTFEIPVPVIAKNPDDLYVDVMKKVQAGYDIHSPTVPLLGHLVTWLVFVPTTFTYVLVYSKDINEFAEKIQSLSARGYDQMFAAFEFKGYACQWMAKEQPSAFAEILQKTHVTHTPAPIAGFNLVEGVHVLGRLSSMNFLPGDIR